jgi:hypothetical protein
MAPRWLGRVSTTLRRGRRRAVAVALAALPITVAGCGTDAVGVQACRQIEEARCREAPGCGVALEPPHHTSGDGVSECILFYDDACLHGLANGSDPGPIAVNACVAAIHNAGSSGGCSVVVNPATTAACSWLVSSSSAGDASSDAAMSTSGDGAADTKTE